MMLICNEYSIVTDTELNHSGICGHSNIDIHACRDSRKDGGILGGGKEQTL